MSTKSDFERKTFCVKIAVDLFVRSWVETWSPWPCVTRQPSTSSWGRELKHKYDTTGKRRNKCRPLREVVSWNSLAFMELCKENGRPLREVVSWNSHEQNTDCDQRIVDLFVRSWVETLHIRQGRSCEGRRPLREVVSWNTYISLKLLNRFVDLFVRSWVETDMKQLKRNISNVDLFVRSWVETWTKVNSALMVKTVDLFVRSWVETLSVLCALPDIPSTSSWGRELKRLKPLVFHAYCYRRPLREVVSWNNFLKFHFNSAPSRPLREVVSWNTLSASL